MRIGIIGAGVAGLTTAKTLKQAGHDVVVFDRTPDVGGVWSATRRYPGLTTQSAGAGSRVASGGWGERRGASAMSSVCHAATRSLAAAWSRWRAASLAASRGVIARSRAVASTPARLSSMASTSLRASSPE